MLTFRLGVTVFFMLTLACAALAQSPTVAATPPMGWNSWNHFAGRVNEANVRAAGGGRRHAVERDEGRRVHVHQH